LNKLLTRLPAITPPCTRAAGRLQAYAITLHAGVGRGDDSHALNTMLYLISSTVLPVLAAWGKKPPPPPEPEATGSPVETILAVLLCWVLPVVLTMVLKEK